MEKRPPKRQHEARSLRDYRSQSLASTGTHAHTHAHVHTCTRISTCAHPGTLAAASPPLCSGVSGAGQGRALLLNARTALGSQRSGTRLSEPAGPCNQAFVGHGLLIFLEKLGFCQVPLLQILPGLVGSCPLKPVGCSGGSEGSQGPPQLLSQPPAPTGGCLASRGDQATQHPPSHKLRPGLWEAQCFLSTPHPQLLVFWFCTLCLFLCERFGSDQLVSQGAHSFHPSVSERVPLLLGTKRQRLVDTSRSPLGQLSFVLLFAQTDVGKSHFPTSTSS